MRALRHTHRLSRMAAAAALLAAALVVASPTAVRAATIVAVTGPGDFAFVVDDNDTLFTSWTQTSTFTDVTIAALIANGPDPGVAYLTTQIGPLTTAAAHEVASAAFAFPSTSTPTMTTVLSGLTLGPGTYFLTLATAGGASWFAPDPETIVMAAGVTLGGSGNGVPDPTYAPAGGFFTFANSRLGFAVEGTAVAPEPATLLLVATGSLVVGAARRRRRRERG